MCFYNAVKMACKCWRWGEFRQHCSRENRVGEVCGMKLVMERHQSMVKCKICIKIATKESIIRREEERIRLWRRARRAKNATPIQKTRDDTKSKYDCARQEARIQALELEVVVLETMLSNIGDEVPSAESASGSSLISHDDKPMYAKST